METTQHSSVDTHAFTMETKAIERASESTRAVNPAQSAAAIEGVLSQQRDAVAQSRPRNWNDVRVKLLAACSRYRFAESARYSKPMGMDANGERRFARGFSIRFAEEVVRCMGNLTTREFVKHDDAERRIVTLVLLDQETNNSIEQDVYIEKTVERSVVRRGQTVIHQRQNSQGQVTYIVLASEDELINKRAAMISKALRNAVMRLLPADIQEDAQDAITKTMQDDEKTNPSDVRKIVCDKFAQIGILPSKLDEYLGHPVAQCARREIDDLRGIYTALRDGETTWSEVMESRRTASNDDSEAHAPASLANRAQTKIDAAKRRSTAHSPAVTQSSTATLPLAGDSTSSPAGDKPTA